MCVAVINSIVHNSKVLSSALLYGLSIHSMKLFAFAIRKRLVHILKARLARYLVEEMNEISLSLVVALVCTPSALVHISHQI